MPFLSLGLSPELVRALSDRKYTKPTDIQSKAIPAILNLQDILGSAETGTGKTAAFTLPLLQLLSQKPAGKVPGVRALVIAPTRELAVQVHNSIREYSKYLKLKAVVVYGSDSMRNQIIALRKGADIVVATPGRLMDHMQRGSIRLNQVEILVLDEADRMLDMGFLPSIREILTQLPKERQTLLFSATFDGPIKQLASQFMRNPTEVQIASPTKVGTNIKHIAHPVDPAKKNALLVKILTTRYQEQILVFFKTKDACNRMAEKMSEEGIPATAIHGNKTQFQRMKALNDFKTGRKRILCATDVAARGLDIPLLPLVINYDLPMVAEDYIHRIGRTGRAGASGEAISLVSTNEGGLLFAINRLLKQDIELQVKEGFEPAHPMRMGGGRGAPARGGRPGGAKPYGKPGAGKPFTFGGKPAGKPPFRGAKSAKPGFSSGPAAPKVAFKKQWTRQDSK